IRENLAEQDGELVDFMIDNKIDFLYHENRTIISITKQHQTSIAGTHFLDMDSICTFGYMPFFSNVRLPCRVAVTTFQLYWGFTSTCFFMANPDKAINTKKKTYVMFLQFHTPLCLVVIKSIFLCAFLQFGGNGIGLNPNHATRGKGIKENSVSFYLKVGGFSLQSTYTLQH
ncbi:hypothetical protein ACJX0J_014188, partial [Zea mays]